MKRQLWILGGAVVAALSCVTPVLVVLLTTVGLSALVGWLDYALFPALFASMGLTAYALYLRSGSLGPSPKAMIAGGVIVLSALIIWLEFRYALRISIAAAAVVALYAVYLRSATLRRTS